MPLYTLSDPYRDFDSREDRAWLDAITAKQGRGITESDLHWVFQSYLPAGTYAECCSYLRPLYDFLHAQNEYHDLWETLVEVWVPMHLKELQQDGTLKAVLGEICAIFEEKLALYLRGEMNMGNMKCWAVSYLYCGPVADRHEALMAQLRQSLHGRMLLLSICRFGHVCEPDNLSIATKHAFSPEHAAYFRKPEEVAQQIRRAQGYADYRTYISQLADEVLDAAEDGVAPAQLLAQWDELLCEEDAATMHLPGGPLYVGT